VFPSLVLGQITEAINHGLLVRSDSDASARHQIVVEAFKTSFAYRQNVPSYDFEVVHGGRDATGMEAKFRLWHLRYVAATDSWTDREIVFRTDRSRLILACGSGQSSVIEIDQLMTCKAQGRTSRAAFWAFCDSIRSGTDPLSGGAPQLVGLYREKAPKVFGIYFDGQRYFDGLPLPDNAEFDGVEWRDEAFQVIDGLTLNIVKGGQRHRRPQL
jgi:hypothetical protein